jgi:hypothetical protein
MRRFAVEAILFIGLQAFVMAVVWFACPRRADHYAAASLDKRGRLESAERPRLIFVGGSSVSFGFDSREVEGTGWSAVNMGHNASLGLSFMLAQVRGALEPGDIVVVAPKYDLLWRRGTYETIITHIEYDPVSIAYVDFDTRRRLCDGGFVWVARKLRCALHQMGTEPDIAFSRGSFDATGDFTAHRGKQPRPRVPRPQPWPDPDALDLDHAFEDLDVFASHCDAVGARCVFAFAPLRRGEFDANRATVERIERMVGESVRLPIVLSVGESLYPEDDFFDAGPHLTEAAARVRTRRLLAALELVASE